MNSEFYEKKGKNFTALYMVIEKLGKVGKIR